MLDSKIVKDKCIRCSNADHADECENDECFVATVVYYQDAPHRDEDYSVRAVWGSLKEAQKWLMKFPRDIWDGFERQEDINRELDKANR